MLEMLEVHKDSVFVWLCKWTKNKHRRVLLAN